MKKHYIQQDGLEIKPEKPDGNGIWHVGGSVCGAVCTTYLLGEYLNSEGPGIVLADSEQEEKIYTECWGAVNLYEMFSDPFKIKQYLESGQAKIKLPVCLKIVGDNEEKHPLFSLLDEIPEDERGEIGKYLIDSGKFNNDMQNWNPSQGYLLGVFADAASLPSDLRKSGVSPKEPLNIPPDDYHYILIHKSGAECFFINPWYNEWTKMPNGPIVNGLCLNDGNTVWKWMDLGLFI